MTDSHLGSPTHQAMKAILYALLFLTSVALAADPGDHGCCYRFATSSG
jgi:hypothetical protein